MPSKKNDELLNATFQQNLSRIPSFFRLSKLSIGIAAVLLAIIIITVIVLIVILPGFNRDGLQALENIAHSIAYISIGAIIALVIIVWFLISLFLEKKAYREASEFAAQHEQWEENKIKEAYIETKTQAPVHEEFKPLTVDPNARICKKCGFPIMDMESRCANCGERYVKDEQ